MHVSRQVITNLPADQLVTTCFVEELLKGEVLGLRNVNRTNSLPEECLEFTGEGLRSVLCRASLSPTGRVVYTIIPTSWDLVSHWLLSFPVDRIGSSPLLVFFSLITISLFLDNSFVFLLFYFL